MKTLGTLIRGTDLQPSCYLVAGNAARLIINTQLER